MFCMGVEIAAPQAHIYNTFLEHREVIVGERAGLGAGMFRYSQEHITFNLRLDAICGHNIHILHLSNAIRVIAFEQ